MTSKFFDRCALAMDEGTRPPFEGETRKLDDLVNV